MPAGTDPRSYAPYFTARSGGSLEGADARTWHPLHGPQRSSCCHSVMTQVC
jgi:hypothetical protein